MHGTMGKAPKFPFYDVGCNAIALRKASRRLTQLYDSALEASGLRSTQFAILIELSNWAANPPTLAELATALVMERSALGHTLRPLERDGLVGLQAGEDRRQRYVVMTVKGKAKCKECVRLWESAQRRFEEVFGRSEAASLRATLLNIAHHERLATLQD
jgi:DNA-binding MarR family transcriptional regulator